MFLASENIDFTGLAHVFLLGGGERRPFCYVAGTLTDENLAHDPAMKARYILICVIRITRVISIACAQVRRLAGGSRAEEKLQCKTLSPSGE